MRKSRILALFMTIVMLISLIQLPVFAAAPVFNDAGVGSGTHRDWTLPYGDELTHFDYSATAGDSPVYYMVNVPNGNADGVSIDASGMLSMNSQPITSSFINIKASTDSTFASNFITSKNIRITTSTPDAPYIHNFDTDPYALSSGVIYDNASFTSTTVLENVELVYEDDEHKYIAVAANSDDNYIGFRAHNGNGNVYAANPNFNSVILQLDAKFSQDEPFSISLTKSGTPIFKWDNETNTIVNNPNSSYPYASFTPPTTVEPGWHNIKIMFDFNKASDTSNPHRVNYQCAAIFFDNELVAPLFKIPTVDVWKENRPDRVISFKGSEGIDNFKYYGSSTPHAYNVALASVPKSGSVVGGSASMYSLGNYTNAETHFIYSYEVSDTVDSSGSYTKVTSTDTADSLYITPDGKLAINGDFTGRYIRVGARVWNRGGMCPVIMSKHVYEIQGYNTTVVTGGTASKNARFRLEAPFDGELSWSFINQPQGVSLTEDGLFTVNDAPSGAGLFKVMNNTTGEVFISGLDFISNSTDGSELSEVIEPVVFSADVDFASTSIISAGSVDFAVSSSGIDGVACSDGATFKFVVEDDVYYAFADDKFIGSDAFTEDITSITADGTLSNYYAGSPLVTDGTFLVCQVDNGYDSNWIEAPVLEFYNESGLYPEGYNYQWYLNDVPVSQDARFYIPGGSTSKTIYCKVTAVTDNPVVAVSNSSVVGSQYNLSVSAPGQFTVSLNTEAKDVYLFFVGDKKTVFAADMEDGDPVTVSLDATDNYDMFFVHKDDLTPRGVSTRILADTSYSDVLLPEGALSNLVIVARDDDLALSSSGAPLFEEPVAYDDLAAVFADKLSGDGREDLSAFIRDAYISLETATSYDDFANQPEGLYNIISIDENGVVTETECYNDLYKLFALPSNYNYVNFKPIAQKALNYTNKEINDVITNLKLVSDKANIAPLMGTKGEYFPASVLLQLLSEQSVPSDASLKYYETYLEKAGLSSDVVKIMEFSTFYSSAMGEIVSSDGIALVNEKIINSLVLKEVEYGKSTTDIRLGLTLIGSSVFNNASKDAQKYAAAAVAKRAYANISLLKQAAETAVNAYKPDDKKTNEDSKYEKPSSNVSFTGGGSFTPVVPPVEEDPKPVDPVPSFSDTPDTHWAFGYVEKMAKAGVLNGYDGSFRPDDNITRAEFVKVLCTAFDVKAEGNVSFGDVSADSWYAPYVNVLAAAGIAKGDNGSFRPDDQISRQDAAVLLQRVLAYVGIGLENGELSFTDTNDMSDYAKDAIASLVKAGVINGMEDGSYAPIANITRAQVAKLICVATELGGDK